MADLIERVANAGLYIDPRDQSRIIEAARRARDLGISLDQALGTEPELPEGKVARRDFFLRRAFQQFRPSGSGTTRQFAERVARASRNEFARYANGGSLPAGNLRACLVLALEADPKAATLSERQLRRILDTS